MHHDSQHAGHDRAPMADRALRETQAWVTRAVIGLNLCPFAKAPQARARVRYVVSDATTEDALADALTSELQLLTAAPEDAIETTLLVHPFVLEDFAVYNDFLGVADALLATLALEGVVQVASFHPQYRFVGTAADDPSNATNRSPYPTLHLLRESSIDRAVDAFPDAEAIYAVNIETMRRLGSDGWSALTAACRADADEQGDRSS